MGILAVTSTNCSFLVCRIIFVDDCFLSYQLRIVELCSVASSQRAGNSLAQYLDFALLPVPEVI